MENRQEVADAVAYLCKKGQETYDELFPTKDRTAGDAPKLKFVENFVGSCLHVAINSQNLSMLKVKSAAEVQAEKEAAEAAAAKGS